MRAASKGHLWSTLPCLVALVLGFAETGHAAPPGGQVDYDSASVNYAPPPTERRGGFAMGISTGFGAGAYRGYELSVDALNDPNQRQTTGGTIATLSTLWLGGSPRDWLTLGIGLQSMSAQGPEVFGAGTAAVAHIEGYPLYFKGGVFRDLGLGISGGLGVVNLVDSEERDFEEPLATSGSLSTLSLFAFWETWHVWHFSFGPSLDYTHAFSQTMNVNQVTLSFRASLYGVRPKKNRGGG